MWVRTGKYTRGGGKHEHKAEVVEKRDNEGMTRSMTRSLVKVQKDLVKNETLSKHYPKPAVLQ